MLINKSIWLCLLFLSIVSGCGVSHEVHQQILDQLESEQVAHSDTITKLETTAKELKDAIKELSRINGLLLVEKQENKKTEKALEILQNRLDETETELKSVKKQLSNADTELKSVKKQLSNADTELKSVKKQLEIINSEYKKLRQIIVPTIEDYFTLGRLLVNEGIKEKDDRNFTKAEEILNKAIIYLRKVTAHKNKFSTDAYYYIARSYYEINDHENALTAAKKAIELANGKHLNAQRIIDTIRK